MSQLERKSLQASGERILEPEASARAAPLSAASEVGEAKAMLLEGAGGEIV